MRGMVGSRGFLAFIVAVGLMAGIKLLFHFYPGGFPLSDQAAAFTWPTIAAIVLLAAFGLAADRSLGFPEPFTDPKNDRRGLWISIALGALYGAITVARDLAEHGVHPNATAAEWDHLPLPWSIPFYTFGAIFLELFLRLGLLCVGVWLIHVVLLRRRFRLVVFWVVACLVAAYEIIPYVSEDIAAEMWIALALAPLEPLYWTNVLEAWLLLRFGWVAPIVFRLAFYLIWHVLYGGLWPSIMT